MIDQAKKLAKEIRFQDDEEIPNTPVFRQGADMIDALCAEIERLKQSQKETLYEAIRQGSEMRAEIERLRGATQQAKDWLEWFCGEPSLHPKIKAPDLLDTLIKALENKHD